MQQIAGPFSFHRRWLRLAVAAGGLVLALGLISAPLAAYEENVDYLTKVSTELVTPHLEWARPGAGGKLRILFISPRSIAPREIVELHQRFEFDFAAFLTLDTNKLSGEFDPLWGEEQLLPGMTDAERAAEVNALARETYDVYVVANVTFDILPTEAKFLILKRVKEGAGLLFTYGRKTTLALPLQADPAGSEAIWQGIPFAGLDYFNSPAAVKALGDSAASRRNAILNCSVFGRGRVVTINYMEPSPTYFGGHGLTPPENYTLNWPANYEGYLLLVDKGVRWAAQVKSSRVTITAMPEAQLQAEQLPKIVRLGLDAAEAISGAELEVRIRDKTNEIEHTKTRPIVLVKGVNTVDVEVPKLKAGGHFLDFILRSPAGVEQWGSAYLDVASPLRIASLRPASDFRERGDDTTLVTTLSQPAGAGTSLRFSGWDTAGRLIVRKEQPISDGAKEVTAMCNLDLGLTIAARIRAELVVDGRVADTADTFVFTPKRNLDDFLSVIWGGNNCMTTGLGWMVNRRLKEAGFNASLVNPTPGGQQERVLALSDLPIVSYSTHIRLMTYPNGYRSISAFPNLKDAAFANPEVPRLARENVLNTIKAAVPYGPRIYSLGDEDGFDYKGGYSPMGQAGFKAFLKKEYTSLEQLNREWAASYTNWDEIVLLPVEEAAAKNLWPMLHEQKAYCEQEYADYLHCFAGVIRETDKHALVGAEGSEPGDLERTIQGLDMWSPYQDWLSNETLRSLAPQKLIRGNWWGGYTGMDQTTRSGRASLYAQLLDGAANSSWFYIAITCEGMLASDLSFAEYYKKCLPEFREIQGGIGKALASSRIPDDKIAIHRSQANGHSLAVFGPFGSTGLSLAEMLHQAGYSYRFVTTKEIETGALERGFKTLFLPTSQALSPESCEKIKAFAGNGGLVVADVVPGIMSDHCSPLWKRSPDNPWRGGLDALFGVSRAGPPRPVPADGKSIPPEALAGAQLNLGALTADGSVQTEAGLPANGIPLMLSREAGKGRVMLLNFPFTALGRDNGGRFVSALLAPAGLTPFWTFSGETYYTFRRLQLGEMSLLGIARRPNYLEKPAGPAEIKLHQTYHVYDVRRGKSLGRLNTIRIGAKDPWANLFVLLNAPAAKLVVRADGNVRRGGWATVSLGLAPATPEADQRVIRLEFWKPDKTEAAALRATVSLEKGAAVRKIPLALNDPAGTWVVKAFDVLTGRQAKTDLVVE